MDISPIAYAIPVFFVLIGLELLVARHRGLQAYHFHDAITDLSCGIGSRIAGVGGKALGLVGYSAVWHLTAIFTVEPDWWSWVAVIVGVDFCYYWLHRAGHRVNVVWAGHVVHHQSEDYNLAVALRQSWYIPFVEWIFYLPLAVLGFPPVMYLAATAINTLYQFWIHTETIGRMGPLEWVFNTPSHHRVHHGTNPEYIDKNYGGITIIWDRLFGTFEAEKAEVVYGTIKPLRSWNPLWANVANWVTMAQTLRSARGLTDVIAILFGPSGWTPDGIAPPPRVSRATQDKYGVEATAAINWYVGVSYLNAVMATVVFMAVTNTAPPAHLLVLGALVLAGIVAWGGLFERRRWAPVVETARLILTPIGVWYVGGGHPVYTAGFALWSVIAVAWLRLALRGASTATEAVQ